MTATTSKHALAASALACGLALSLGACDGGREYTVPPEACGVPVGEKALDPFLVDGKELKVLGKPLATSKGNCAIWVDEWLVVNLRLEKVDKLYDPMDESEEFRFKNRAKVKDVPFGGLGAVGDFNAMVSTECAAPDAKFVIAYVEISLESSGDVTRRRENIESFALDFVPKAKKTLGCTA
ncbi:hypothetical protein [Streptomyces niveus]|uniref:DUF3558 domain-containing protein n=1 Tax=Streptomyces niveus TaxID=193462 RepID=A0ABZ2AC08_STRNV|nr:hypothetical protein [Streptomyces niveus]